MPAAERFVTQIDREADVGELLENGAGRARPEAREALACRGAQDTGGVAVRPGHVNWSRLTARMAPQMCASCPAQACRPQTVLTRRELEVATRIARGFSNRQIAEDLVITLSTTERHVANILGKLQMRSRSQVAAWVVERGL